MNKEIVDKVASVKGELDKLTDDQLVQVLVMSIMLTATRIDNLKDIMGDASEFDSANDYLKYLEGVESYVDEVLVDADTSLITKAL